MHLDLHSVAFDREPSPHNADLEMVREKNKGSFGGSYPNDKVDIGSKNAMLLLKSEERDG